VITNATVREVREGEVVIEDHEFGRTTLAVSDVVSCHTRPVVDLFGQLEAAGVHAINVGDSLRPRNLYHAVKEGSAFGLAVDEHMLFNPNHAILNELPIDVLAQLRREEGPAYSSQQIVVLAGRRDG
jgi:predicted HAD superfamily phosphohydrolase